ncbi:MAG TPA: RHS repeat-associated core domain-containing protein, partial [Mycobacteriales bacterium]|nr:RHS repeat-associated core domain-containing protein [Mycobacteriales bacterium]
MIDRNGTTNSLTYDILGRTTTLTVGAHGGTASTTLTYSYDLANRLTQAHDPTWGTLTNTWDDFDALTSQTTPHGTVTYQYDREGRRTAMTATGKPAVTYAYDAANRVTSLGNGSVTIGVTYDANSRLQKLSLPGATQSYSYDLAGETTGITYAKGATTLGSLLYAYDADGNHVSEAGSFARATIPAAASGAYNADNEQTSWHGASLSYDAEGQLISDGTSTFAWDGRHNLRSITGTPSATFGYDPEERRTTRTVGGASRSYLYDGSNAVQELSGTTPTAQLFTGGVDEALARVDAQGTHALLTDGLGSVIAVTDGTGSLTTQYTYGPFGATTASGSTTSNSSQFAGRENDGDGLYFNRARYYDPNRGRFLSQDPAGIGARSANLYTYVGNNPTDAIDPSGRFAQILVGAAAGCIVGGAANALGGWLSAAMSGNK